MFLIDLKNHPELRKRDQKIAKLDLGKLEKMCFSSAAERLYFLKGF
jgi:hypothetical protein